MIPFAIIIFILNLVSVVLYGVFYYCYEAHLLTNSKAFWLFAVPFWFLQISVIFVFCALVIMFGG